MAAVDLQLPPGFRFHPTDDELVMHYLVRKCASQSIAVPIIAEIDLYKYDPWQLPGIEPDPLPSDELLITMDQLVIHCYIALINCRLGFVR